MTKFSKFKIINPQGFPYGLFFMVLALSFFGLLMIYEASSVVAIRDFGDKFYFARDQFKWMVLGIGVMLFLANFDYRLLYKLSLPLLILEILFLLAVFIPGIGVRSLGASRWLNFRFVSFQPSELAKIVLMIYLSAWLSSKEKGRLTAFFILMVIFGGLIVLQPDMGTMIILSLTAIFIYFLSGAPIWHFIIIGISAFFGMAGLIKIVPYRMNRWLAFLNPQSDPLGVSYHINQILISLGSGGFWGLGIGKSRQKFAYLPEATTDSIFAIIAEEFGFIGSLILIICLFLLFYQGYKIALGRTDKFGRLLGFGLTLYLFFQTVINLMGILALIPLTGVPLPFISYGGSSLIVSMMAIGIILNIGR